MRRISACLVVLLAAAALTQGPVADAKTLKSGRFYYVTESFDLPTTPSFAQASVLCPDGTQFTGAGAALPAGVQGQLHYVGMTKGEGALVSASTGANPDGKKLKVTAVCVDELNVLLVFDDYSTPGEGTSSADVSCAGEDVLIGGGGGDFNGPLAPHENYPASSSTWRTTTTNPSATPDDGFLVARCISPGIVPVEQVTQGTNLSSGESVKVKCPKGSRVSAGGYQLGPDIRASVPFDGKDNDRAPDDGWRLIGADGQTPDDVTLHAVCVGNQPFD